MIEPEVTVEKLLEYAKTNLHLNSDDVVYMRNLLLAQFRLDRPAASPVTLGDMTLPDELIREIEECALERNLCEKGQEELFSNYIFGLLTPLPSVINEKFFALRKEKGADAACEYLYNISVKNNYIRKTAIEKNLKWEYDDGKTGLVVTVNLSKPEKDNKDIAKLITKKSDNKYPACALCKENEGFSGTLNHPPRTNIRTVSLKLGGEDWFMQYSPYAYFEEHCIAVNKTHTPMKVTRATADKLLDFVDIFEGYFIGSNAALPIVGGSILNHEHFQGGKHVLPMKKAKSAVTLKSPAHPGVKCCILDWYNSALRISSPDRKELSLLAGDIIECWSGYSDETVGIFASTAGVPHNTLSPICYKNGDTYVMDFILRNNITTEKYPDGVFHAHPEYFNIKKEGIGLIEAMGLFVLPGRLKRQTAKIAKVLIGEKTVEECDLCDEKSDLYVHGDMIKYLVDRYGTALFQEQADRAIRDYINGVLVKILECTAVFKGDEKGKRAFEKFVAAAGFEIQ